MQHDNLPKLVTVILGISTPMKKQTLVVNCVWVDRLSFAIVVAPASENYSH